MEGASGRVLVLAPLAISTDRTPAAQPAAQPQCPQEHGNRTATASAWLEPQWQQQKSITAKRFRSMSIRALQEPTIAGDKKLIADDHMSHAVAQELG